MGCAASGAVKGSDSFARIEKEIIDIHQFFQDWMSGALEGDKKVFDKNWDGMASNFTMIFPEEGTLLKKSVVSEVAFTLAGKSGKDFKIWITDIEVLQELPEGICLATYVEHQQKGSEPETARRSSAIFRLPPAGRPEWLHLHETWTIPPPAAPKPASN